MAVPTNLTTLDISGKYTVNKELTDQNAMDSILSLQGVGWIARKAAKMASVSLAIKHYVDTDGTEHIDIIQEATGMPSKTEGFILNGEVKESKNPVLGAISRKTKRVKVDELDVGHLKNGWTAETVEYGVVLVEVQPTSGPAWKGRQTWGIEEHKGERRHVRRLKFTGPKGEDIETKIYHDYIAPL